jgi:hypothetical protein
MKRNIHITNQFDQKSFAESSPVAIENINTIVNYSVDNIICRVIEYIPEKDFEPFLGAMLSKLRDNGSVTFIFTDLKTIFIEYINQKVSSSLVFESLKNKQNIVSIDKIISVLNQFSLIVSKIDKNQNQIILIAHKQPPNNR